MQKNLVELQKSNEPLKALSSNLNRMNSLFTVCNKRLDTLDNKIDFSSKISGKRKEPPGLEKSPSRMVKAKDDNT